MKIANKAIILQKQAKRDENKALANDAKKKKRKQKKVK